MQGSVSNHPTLKYDNSPSWSHEPISPVLVQTWEPSGGSNGGVDLIRRDDRLCNSMTVVKHFKYVAGTFVQNLEEFLHLLFMIYGPDMFMMDQIIFDIRKS